MQFKYIEKQQRVANQIVEAFKKYNTIFLSAPTGSGKSGIAYLSHEQLFNEDLYFKSTILAHQKVLMDQYSSLLGGMNNVTAIKGKENYICEALGDVDVASAPCQFGLGCDYKPDCEYFQLRNLMNTSPLLITNYQLVLSMLDVDVYSRHSNLAIFDECHNLESLFTEYRKVSVDSSELRILRGVRDSLNKHEENELANPIDDLILKIERFDTDNAMKSFKEIFDSKKHIVDKLSEKFQNSDTVKYYYNKDSSFVKKISQFILLEKRMFSKWYNYTQFKDTTQFIFDFKYTDEVNFNYTLTPLYIDNMFGKTTQSISDKRLLMSSTIWKPEKMRAQLGQDEDFEFIELDNEFPPRNRQVNFTPVEGINAENSQFDHPTFNKLCKQILSICQKHSERNESGVIFAPSYKLCFNIEKKLRKELSQDFRIIMNSSSEERNSAMDEFLRSKQKTILISPSFSEGVNFTDDISRFQIIAKCPYMYLGDKFVRVKAKKDPVWYETNAFTTIIQAAGRSVRHKEDYAYTYVLDANALKLYTKYEKDIPKWFRDSVSITPLG